MRLPIRLGPHVFAWRFPDSDRLGDWIDARPWHDRSEVRVVRVADPGVAAAVAGAVRRAVVGADEGTADIRCHHLPAAAVAADGFAGALAAALELPPVADRYARHDALARRLADRPAFCLVDPLPGDTPAAFHDATGSAELIGQLVPAARVCAVFLDTPARPLTGPAFDLSAGGPAFGPEFVALPADRLWGAYLHVRLAWEAAGDPVRAAAVAAAVLDRLPPGDDAALERGLNRYAADGYGRLDGEARRRLEVATAAPGAVRAADRQAARRVLAEAGLFWTPRELDDPVPVPWVARGWLLAGPDARTRGYLRGCVVCAPLARDLLGICLQLEARDRGRLVDPSVAPTGEEMAGHWDRFQQGKTLCSRMHPAECPAVPDGPWPFASLGEVYSRFGGNGSARAARNKLLDLRNHLAHGHYVGWEAVRLAVELRQHLAG